MIAIIGVPKAPMKVSAWNSRQDTNHASVGCILGSISGPKGRNISFVAQMCHKCDINLSFVAQMCHKCAKFGTLMPNFTQIMPKMGIICSLLAISGRFLRKIDDATPFRKLPIFLKYAPNGAYFGQKELKMSHFCSKSGKNSPKWAIFNDF